MKEAKEAVLRDLMKLAQKARFERAQKKANPPKPEAPAPEQKEG